MKRFRKSLHQVNRRIGAHKRATIPRRPFQLSSKQNTRKLFRVCAGLRSDIREVKNQLDQKSQSHTSHLVPVSSSLHLSINSVGIAVVWLARQFTDFSVEVLRHLKSLTDSNIEIYLLLLRILNGIFSTTNKPYCRQYRFHRRPAATTLSAVRLFPLLGCFRIYVAIRIQEHARL